MRQQQKSNSAQDSAYVSIANDEFYSTAIDATINPDTMAKYAEHKKTYNQDNCALQPIQEGLILDDAEENTYDNIDSFTEKSQTLSFRSSSGNNKIHPNDDLESGNPSTEAVKNKFDGSRAKFLEFQLHRDNFRLASEILPTNKMDKLIQHYVSNLDPAYAAQTQEPSKSNCCIIL